MARSLAAGPRGAGHLAEALALTRCLMKTLLNWPFVRTWEPSDPRVGTCGIMAPKRTPTSGRNPLCSHARCGGPAGTCAVDQKATCRAPVPVTDRGLPPPPDPSARILEASSNLSEQSCLCLSHTPDPFQKLLSLPGHFCDPAPGNEHLKLCIFRQRVGVGSSQGGLG